MEIMTILSVYALLASPPPVIEHIGINSKPTFSYIMVHISSSDFDFDKFKEGKTISILVRGVSTPKRKPQIRGDKLVKDVYITQVKEGDGRINSLISIKLQKEDIDWYAVKSKSLIFVFVGKNLPFSQKIDLEEYFRESVRIGNFSALDIMFSFSQVEDPVIRALSLYYIGEMFMKMGLTQRSRLILLRAGAYYGISASEFFSFGKIEEAVNLRLKSSEAFRISGFYPEAEFQALQAIQILEKYNQRSTSVSIPKDRLDELTVLALCYRSLALAGARRFEKAVENFYRIDLKQIPDRSRDCIYSFLGIIEFEKGNFEEAQRYLSYVSGKFILSEPLVLPRYVRMLIDTGKFELAKKYAFAMIDSIYPEMQGQGYIYLLRALVGEGNYQTAVRYIWRAISKFAGTRWEILARLIAIENKEKFKKIYDEIPKREIPRNDPVLEPLPNLRFIIHRFVFPESYEAVPLYISEIIDELKNVKEQDFELISGELDLLDEILRVFRVLNLPPNVKEKVRQKNLELAQELVRRGRKLEAASFFLGNKDFFPPDYSEDITFLKRLTEELGFSEAKMSEVVETLEIMGSESDLERRFGKDLPRIYLNHMDHLISKNDCEKAFSYFKGYNEKIKHLPEYNDLAFRLAYCLFLMKSFYLKEFCSFYAIDIFCYPSRTTYDEILERTVKEIMEELQK